MNGNAEGEYIGESRRVDNSDELIAHYKQRMRAMLPYMRHNEECAYTKWKLCEMLQAQYGTGYSAGPMPACTCGAAALVLIVQAEVEGA